MEQYHAKHGKYPEQLNNITPDFLKSIPVCPATCNPKTMTYQLSKDKNHYILYIKGEHYKPLNIPKDYPRYDSTKKKVLLQPERK